LSMADLRQAEEYDRFMESLGWVVEKKVFIKKLPLLPFSFIKYQRPGWPIDLKLINRLAKKYRAIQVKIEPDVIDRTRWDEVEKEMEKNGYRSNKTPLLPTRTIWLDLRKSEQQLLKEMHHKTRYNIRKYEGQGAKSEIVQGSTIADEQLKEFYEVYKENSRKQKYWGLNFKQLKSLVKCFGKKSYLLLVKQEKLLGGLVLLVHGRVAYYSHNAASKEGKKQYVPNLLGWEAIKRGLG